MTARRFDFTENKSVVVVAESEEQAAKTFLKMCLRGVFD